jgi:hypothetical protein
VSVRVKFETGVSDHSRHQELAMDFQCELEVEVGQDSCGEQFVIVSRVWMNANPLNGCTLIGRDRHEMDILKHPVLAALGKYIASLGERDDAVLQAARELVGDDTVRGRGGMDADEERDWRAERRVA